MKKDLIFLLILTLPAFALLFQKGYFTMHDDLQSMRQYQLDKCLADGQIPCRWVSDMGYGYGYPLFNYYPPLPYYLGQVFRTLGGLAYIDVVKVVGVLGFVTTAVFMYLLSRQFWGRLGGLVSAAFYTYAPYHSVDFYVRGAMNEFWAMAFYPAIFWTTYRLIADRHPRWIPWVSLSVAALMLSHNPMLMIFAPVYLVWIFFWWWRFHSLQSFKHLAVAALWAAGFAAFFTLPVLFEKKFAHLETLTIGYFNYLAHFLDLNQIFLRINWGYGESVYGPGDTMSFALGYLHWLVPAVILLLTPFVKKLRNTYWLVLLAIGYTLFALFMSHFKATPIWQAIQPFEFLQFPWRFLTLAVFSASFVSGAVVLVISRKFIPLLFVLLLLLNANYFRPRAWLPDTTDAKKFSGHPWQLLVTSGIFDYLPIWAPMPPADPRGDEINILSGRGIYSPLTFKSNLQQYLVTMFIPGTIELQTYYFPGWRYWLDGIEVKNYKLDPLLGRPQIAISSGRHEILARFTNTPIRTIGNTLSLIAWTTLIGIMASWWKGRHRENGK